MADIPDDEIRAYRDAVDAEHARLFDLHGPDVGDKVDLEWHTIRAVLVALAAAGRLRPAGGETREEWGHHWIAPGGTSNDCGGHRDRAAAEHAAAATRDVPGWNAYVVCRTVTTWPDGSVLTGPWTEVADG